jgi:pimeloyl-ACP methyl ester carboxylesterase
MTFTNPLLTRKLIELFVANPATVTDYGVGVYQAALHVKGTSTAVGDWLPQLVAERDMSMSSDRASYKTLAMPAGIIWGDKDTTTALDVGKDLARVIPGSCLIVLTGLDHMPPVENPETFNQTLLQLLRS